MGLLYLRTRQGIRRAIMDARRARAYYGTGITFERHVTDDGAAFCFSLWLGATYLGSSTSGYGLT